MKCYMPFVNELEPSSTFLLQIARELGVECLPLALSAGSTDLIRDIETSSAAEGECITLSPSFLQKWSADGQFPSSLASFLIKRFRFLLLHSLDASPVSAAMIRALSADSLGPVHRKEETAAEYKIAQTEMCGAFSGHSFGPASPEDHTFDAVQGNAADVDAIVSVGSRPFFCRVRRGSCDLYFLGSTGPLDSEQNLHGHRLSEYFSRLVPFVFFFRHVFQQECWRPLATPAATLIIDDPPLSSRYGFLNYEKLLALMDKFNFHSTVAFIPYYWNRRSLRTVRLFQERSDRFSICLHGNDHTGGEFAAQDVESLHGMLQKAEARMHRFQQLTGLCCERVMVFPQETFSRSAMLALRENGFVGVASGNNTPVGEPARSTVFDALRPSLLRYGGPPIFPRKLAKNFTSEDVALNALIGRPTLIAAHHDDFQDPADILNIVSRINQMVPHVRWCSLQSAMESTCLERSTSNGISWIRPYATRAKVPNPTTSSLQCIAEWPQASQVGHAPATPTLDGIQSDPIEDDAEAIRMRFDIAPGGSRTIALKYNSNLSAPHTCESPFRPSMKIHLRRRLSELRDNYLSRSPAMMALVNSVRSALSKGN